ncbi:Ger(x)C family spore germination protein [Paenibacillus sp. GCM10027627]|uniref:Ger(x)C family spore germination protein n=1 Tax=unclassified Paenibacillus TaxID=185978 RepID=UPI00362A3B8E
MFRVYRRLLLAAATASLMLLLSACWDNKDINHRSLPIVMGLAKYDDHYKMYLQIPEVTSNRTRLRIVEETGETISQIVDKISMNMDNRVDLMHLKVLLVDKAYAKGGMNDSINSFIRAQDISPKTMMAICDEPLEQFFANLNKYDTKDGTVLIDFFEKNAGWNPQVAQTRLWEMFRSIYSFTHDTIVPIIQSGGSTLIESKGSAIIKNGRMVDRITPGETLLINAFNGLSTQGKIEVMDHADIQIVSNKISHKSKVTNNKAMLTSRIRFKVTILETKGDPSIEQVQRELETQLSQRMSGIVAKIKKRKADVLSMGQLFRGKLSREQLEHWRQNYLPEIDLTLKVDVIVENEGNLTMRRE